MLISGPTMSGKSHFIKSLIQNRNELFDVTFGRILYSTPYALSKIPYLDQLREMCPDIELAHSVPDFQKDQLFDDEKPTLLILDDLDTDVGIFITVEILLQYHFFKFSSTKIQQ